MNDIITIILPLYCLYTNADARGTSPQQYVKGSYADLVRVFGEPNSDVDGYEVSTEWVLRNTQTNEVVTLYDYKATNLYDHDYPSVAEFRAQPYYAWHVGAKSKEIAREFVKWLLTQVAPQA